MNIFASWNEPSEFLLISNGEICFAMQVFWIASMFPEGVMPANQVLLRL